MTIDILPTVDMTVPAIITRRSSPRTAPVYCCRPLAEPALSDAEAEATAALFRALAEPARVKIVNLLATSEAPVCACEFEPALGLAQPTVSHHLKKLTEAGLLEREQRGRWAYFSLNREALALLGGLVQFREVTT
jgi:ArsR family transcriptional regulator